LPTSNAATRWMIWSWSWVSSSTQASLRSDDQRVVARRSRRARGESDPRARGDSEGPMARLPAPGLSTASDDQGHPASAGNHPNFHPGTGAAGRHRGLSGTFAGCVQAGSAEDDQLIGGVQLTVVVRWLPGLPVRCGTRVARHARKVRPTSCGTVRQVTVPRPRHASPRIHRAKKGTAGGAVFELRPPPSAFGPPGRKRSAGLGHSCRVGVVNSDRVAAAGPGQRPVSFSLAGGGGNPGRAAGDRMVELRRAASPPASDATVRSRHGPGPVRQRQPPRAA
jgi:hypothetical protein